MALRACGRLNVRYATGPSRWSTRSGVPVSMPASYPATEVRMGEVAYRSQVCVERIKGSLRHAWLPVETAPVKFATHGAVAEHYGAKPGEYEPHATTLDYIVAAAAG